MSASNAHCHMKVYISYKYGIGITKCTILVLSYLTINKCNCHFFQSGTSLGGSKPYINAQGKLVRPSSRHSSSDHLSDSEQRLPEPEVPTGRSRHVGLDNDQSNLVSYLV